MNQREWKEQHRLRRVYDKAQFERGYAAGYNKSRAELGAITRSAERMVEWIETKTRELREAMQWSISIRQYRPRMSFLNPVGEGFTSVDTSEEVGITVRVNRAAMRSMPRGLYMKMLADEVAKSLADHEDRGERP